MLRPLDTYSQSHSVAGRGWGRSGSEMRLKSEIDQVERISWTAEPRGLPSMGWHRVGHD